jgi:hypothetical protein
LTSVFKRGVVNMGWFSRLESILQKGDTHMRCGVSITRSAGTWVEVLVFLFVLTLGLGLLLVWIQRAWISAASAQSRNNLKQIGIALNNYAGANANELPQVNALNAPYFFCGQTGGTNRIDAVTLSTPLGVSQAPFFTNGLLAFMDGNTKGLIAPLDVNIGHANPERQDCSYSIPAYWATLTSAGIITLPGSFTTGTSECIAAAEMTTQGVSYSRIVPFSLFPYTSAETGTPSSTANYFSRMGCNVVMVDASVHTFTLTENDASHFVIAQVPGQFRSYGPSPWGVG